jgi:hypothetical protein
MNAPVKRIGRSGKHDEKYNTFFNVCQTRKSIGVKAPFLLDF